MKRTKRATLGLFLFLVVLFIPQIWLNIKYKKLIYSEIDMIPKKE